MFVGSVVWKRLKKVWLVGILAENGHFEGWYWFCVFLRCMSNIWRYVGTVKINDWNFVMSVVEKIGSGNVCSVGDYYFRVLVEKDKCTIHTLDRLGCIVVGKDMVYEGNGILCVQKACVGFVRWYNDNRDRGE